MAIYQTAQEKEILTFFNEADLDKYMIQYRIRADPNFGSAPASGYGITLDTAQRILDRRTALGDTFSSLKQIDNITRVGPVTMHNILYSFSDTLRAWTASADGQRVGTLRDVGIGTLAAEERLQVYDGALSVKSYLSTTEQVAMQSTQGSAYDVFVLGNYAYIADESDFTIFDISDPNKPTDLDNNIQLNEAHGLFVSGDYAYVADGSDGLQIIDVSDPAKPVLVKTLDTPGNATGVWVVGDYAYVTDDSQGLQVIDISNPSNPSFMPEYDTNGSAEDVYVAGNYAFVADGSKGIQILDISDPANPPTLVNSFDTDGDSRCVYVHGEHAYVADGSKGLQIIDISDPVGLVRVGSFDTAKGQADDIYVSGNHAYVANGVSGVQVFDISDVANPKLVDEFLVDSGDAKGIFVSGNHAYVADRNKGLIIYHVLTASRIGSDSYFGGNVGIGTTNPTSKLHVANVGGNVTIARFLDSITNSGFRFTINDADDSLGYGAPSRHGIKVSSSESMAFLTHNTDVPQMVIDTDGNVGIGTTNPSQKLEVNGNIKFSDEGSLKSSRSIFMHLDQEGNNGGTWFSVMQGSSDSELFRVQQNGNVGIGTTTPSYGFHVQKPGDASPSVATIEQTAATNYPTLRVLQDTAGGNENMEQGLLVDVQGSGGVGGRAFHVKGQSSSRFLVMNTGNVGIGTTSPKAKLDVKGDIQYSGAIDKASSRELKENISDLSIQEAFEAVRNLNPVKFNLKGDEGKRLHLGFIAEDTSDLAATPDKKAVTNDHIVAVLTKVVKDQQMTILSLQDEVKFIKGEIN